MTSLIFPDLNVWVALSLTAHGHSKVAWEWYRSLRPGEELVFCRMSQLSLLRLLTTESVAKHETLTQVQAWAIYDGWLEKGGALFLEEPFSMETELRFYADRKTPSPREWADSYLIAFAAAASIPLVTFDRGLSQRYARSILLG
ncbi:MAG TPA: TA system VapC family ribonuclease toxin [Acidobacteriaceae bacterium]|nr:TA system VapC family ribonuclease toxin [Acidobacteriaceae bacterium]